METNAAQTEGSKVQYLRAAADSVRGKLSMFEAKHGTDYGVSMGAHMECLAAEEAQISSIYGATRELAATVKAAKPASGASLETC